MGFDHSKPFFKWYRLVTVPEFKHINAGSARLASKCIDNMMRAQLTASAETQDLNSSTSGTASSILLAERD